jgi:Co/Zn/Cd efflux system component
MSDSIHMLVDGSSQLTYWVVLTLIMWGMLTPSWLKKRALSISNRLKQFDASILWMIGDVASAIFLFGAGITSIFLALRRLLDPQEVHVEVSFSVAVIGLIINLISLLIMLASGTQKDLTGIFLHVKADLYDSIVVIAGQLVVWSFRGEIEFAQYVDPLLSLWLGKKMMVWAWNLQKTALQGKTFHLKGILIQYPVMTSDHCSEHDHGSENAGHAHHDHH